MTESIAARRLLLRYAAASALALPFAGCALLKASKSEAKYQPYPNGDERCGDCRYFVASFNACSQVQGHIEPDGWCRFWKA